MFNPFAKKSTSDNPIAVAEQEKAKRVQEQQQQLVKGLTSIQDIIAPPSIEVDFAHLKIGELYYKTLFAAGYPRFVDANWLSPLINFDHPLSISMYIYPIEGKDTLEDLKRKIGEMEAEIQTDLQRGRVPNIGTQVQLEDARALQEQLAKGTEHFFQFGLYITVIADDEKELRSVAKKVQSLLGSLLILTKPATLQMEEAFKTTLPFCTDYLKIYRNMDTTSLATTFPFTSSELTDTKGIMYGINAHNESLIIFDRFSLENANAVIFAKSGAGKSYFVKLEALRYMYFDTEIIVIDPESEYVDITEAVSGARINFAFNSPIRINPFDLSATRREGENELNIKVLSLHSLFKLMMGNLDPIEEAILDKAIILTYRQKGITTDPTTQGNIPPLMEDLYKVLIGMEDKKAATIAARLERFIQGSMRGILDQHTNFKVDNPFTVFDIKELSDELRPIAMFIILDFIWTKVRRELRRRLLIVDEAWYMMTHPDSALFLYGMAKRARKYYLGVSTITQDVEDFMNTDMGKAIVTNSSIQVLLKQSSAAIDKLAEVFYLSEGEKNLLVSAGVGEGLFFAGSNHVAMRVVASQEEHKLITSKPEEIMARRQKAEADRLAAIKAKPMSKAEEALKSLGY